MDDEDLAHDAEIIRNLWRTKHLLNPDGVGKNRWDNWILLLVAYSSIELPLMWAFRVTPSIAQLVIDYLLDLFFLADVVVALRTTWRLQETNELELDDKTVMRRYYTKNRLVPLYDFFAWFPLEVLVAGLANWRATTAFAVLRLPRWIFRIIAYRTKPDKHSKAANPMTNVVSIRLARVARLFISFLFFAHWVACFWWMLGTEQVGHLNIPTPYQRRYIDSWTLRPHLRSLVLTNETPLGQRYLSSFYWSLSTLMKTAWITPGTTWEKLFGCVVVFLGAIIFAFILASVSAVVNAFDDANAKRREKMSTMLRFASTRKLTPRVTSQLLNYVDAEWTWTGGIDPPAFLKSTQIPARLRGEMLREMQSELTSMSPLFKGGLHKGFITSLLHELVPQAVTKTANLVAVGELCFETFILTKGMLNVFVNDDELGTVDDGGDSNRGSPNPRASGSDGGNALKRTTTRKSKKKINQRAVERAGACIGVWSPYISAWRAPYTATAPKLALLYGIRAEAMKRAIEDFKWHEDDVRVLGNLEREFAQVVGQNGVQAQLNKYGLKSNVAKPVKPSKVNEEAPSADPAADIKKKRRSSASLPEAIAVSRKVGILLSDKLVDTEEACAAASKAAEEVDGQAAKMHVLLAGVKHLLDPANNTKPALSDSPPDDKLPSARLGPPSHRTGPLSNRDGGSSNRYLDSKLAEARQKKDDAKGVTEKAAVTDERQGGKGATNEAMIVAM